VVLAWLFDLTTGGVIRHGGEATDASVAADGAIAGNTTLLFGATDSVRARWKDSEGNHERVFFGAFRVGRDESCEVRFDDPLISRRHAEIRFEQGRWWVIDLASRNGTRLDGRLVERAPLPPICTVQLYDASPVLNLELGGPSAAAITMATRPKADPAE
jgi:pSer/pThr/pTyr-binding forkhead associated (FHA) protein